MKDKYSLYIQAFIKRKNTFKFKWAIFEKYKKEELFKHAENRKFWSKRCQYSFYFQAPKGLLSSSVPSSTKRPSLMISVLLPSSLTAAIKSIPSYAKVISVWQ